MFSIIVSGGDYSNEAVISVPLLTASVSNENDLIKNIRSVFYRSLEKNNPEFLDKNQTLCKILLRGMMIHVYPSQDIMKKAKQIKEKYPIDATWKEIDPNNKLFVISGIPDAFRKLSFKEYILDDINEIGTEMTINGKTYKKQGKQWVYSDYRPVNQKMNDILNIFLEDDMFECVRSWRVSSQ